MTNRARPPVAPVYLTPAAQYMLGFIAACLFIYVCMIAKAVMIPFVIAVFIWYLAHAIARLLSRLGRGGRPLLPRPWRLFIALVVISAVIWVIAGLVRGNIDEVVREAPKFQHSFENLLEDGARRLGMHHTPSLNEMVESLTEHLDIGHVMVSFAAMLTALAGKMVVILLFLGFFLYEQRFFPRKLHWIMRDPLREARAHDILRTIDIKIQRYIGVKAFVSAMDSVLTFFILVFYGVDFAGFWGVMAFFLHFIPYAGSFVAITMPVLIALIQFDDPTVCLYVLATLCVSHAFLGHILDPWMMGNNLNLSPIFIISNLAMWGMIWGVPGMFLAIPILAIVSLALSQFDSTKPIAVLLSKTGVLVPAKNKDP